MIAYAGGKKLLAPLIVSLMPHDRKIYVEPFGGGGWVLFTKPKLHAEYEVFNDINKDLINMYDIIRKYPEEFERRYLLMPKNKTLYYELKETYPNITDPIERAVIYAYLLTQAYGKKSYGFSFARNTKSPRLTFLKVIYNIAQRLIDVEILSQDYSEVMQEFDSPSTFFYLDPPYIDVSPVYYANFKKEDMDRLFAHMINLKGKWILSHIDHPYIRELFKDYHIIEVPHKYSMGTIKNTANGLETAPLKPVKELLVLNYTPQNKSLKLF